MKGFQSTDGPASSTRQFDLIYSFPTHKQNTDAYVGNIVFYDVENSNKEN